MTSVEKMSSEPELPDGFFLQTKNPNLDKFWVALDLKI
jgi:hypothetical protein